MHACSVLVTCLSCRCLKLWHLQNECPFFEQRVPGLFWGGGGARGGVGGEGTGGWGGGWGEEGGGEGGRGGGGRGWGASHCKLTPSWDSENVCPFTFLFSFKVGIHVQQFNNLMPNTSPIYIYTYVYIYTFIHIWSMCICVYIYICIMVVIYIYSSVGFSTCPGFSWNA